MMARCMRYRINEMYVELKGELSLVDLGVYMSEKKLYTCINYTLTKTMTYIAGTHDQP